MLQYRRLFVIILTIIFVFAALNSTHAYGELHQKMDVHFINVGQGDSIFIQTPNNKNILIDGGPPKAGKKVVKYLQEQGIKKIHLMIATHPDMAHQI